MSEVLWAISRVSGIVSLLLFSGTIILGILTWRGRTLPGLPRFAVSLLHRDVSLLATVFVVIHVVTLFGDPYAQVRVIDGVVPFLASADPLWRGLGTVAADLLVAIIITGVVRHRLPAAVFRGIHRATYPMWLLALIHGFGSGTDAGSGWYVGLNLAMLAAVLAALAYRISARGRGTSTVLQQRR